jgi:hypothetical protein
MMFEYLGGLPKGNEQEHVNVDIKDDVLHFSQRRSLLGHGWDYDLPISNIIQTEITKGKLSWLQVPLTGAIGAIFLRSRHGILGIRTKIAGLETTVIIKGNEKDLRKLQQKILQSREKSLPADIG